MTTEESIIAPDTKYGVFTNDKNNDVIEVIRIPSKLESSPDFDYKWGKMEVVYNVNDEALELDFLGIDCVLDLSSGEGRGSYNSEFSTIYILQSVMDEQVISKLDVGGKYRFKFPSMEETIDTHYKLNVKLAKGCRACFVDTDTLTTVSNDHKNLKAFAGAYPGKYNVTAYCKLAVSKKKDGGDDEPFSLKFEAISFRVYDKTTNGVYNKFSSPDKTASLLNNF